MKTITESPLRAWRKMKAEPIHLPKPKPLPLDPVEREAEINRIARKAIPKRRRSK